jgi:hypothetical protein
MARGDAVNSTTLPCLPFLGQMVHFIGYIFTVVHVNDLPRMYRPQTTKRVPQPMKQTVGIIVLVQSFDETQHRQQQPQNGTFQTLVIDFCPFLVVHCPIDHQHNDLQSNGNNSVPHVPWILFLAIHHEPQSNVLVDVGMDNVFVIAQMNQQNDKTQVGPHVVQSMPFAFPQVQTIEQPRSPTYANLSTK